MIGINGYAYMQCAKKYLKIKKGARIEIQPRFKIQYPMKNHFYNGKRHTNIVCR
jgi:hypothetical protein